MTTKHDQILHYIESLPIGERISVRSLAKKLSMSEGTIYRAIKSAEQLGFVSTIERVGTIRIEKKSKLLPVMLKFSEIVSIIDGTVLGGEEGLNKNLNKFIIGAMTVDQIKKYYVADSLMIVGNREDVQYQSLDHDVAVLITGGFSASDKVIKLANRKKLPLISTPFDTFSVATIINRSMAEQEIKKDIVTIDEYFIPIEETASLVAQDTVKDFNELAIKTGLSRFPVHYNLRIIGVVTAKDLIGRGENVPIERVMTKDVITVKKHMTITSVSHLMIREDIEMLPVVSDDLQLLGVISRQDVMKAMQQIQKQPQLGNTYEEQVIMHLDEYLLSPFDDSYDYHTIIQPQMINSLGTLSFGVLCEFIGYTCYQKFYDTTGYNLIIEKIDLNYFYLIQIYNQIQFKITIFYQSRRSAMMQVDIFHENSIVAKAIVTGQIIESN